jgi:hypothetical protein
VTADQKATDDIESVPIHISPELAKMALIAADCFRRLSPREIAKAQSRLQTVANTLRPTAKNLQEVCSLVGFVFAMQLDEARQKRLAEMGVTTQ